MARCGREFLGNGLVILVLVVATMLLVPDTGFTAGGLLQEVKNKGELVVATDTDFPPFAFIENGNLVGYCPDLITLVAKSLGVKVRQVGLPFAGLLPGLLAHKYDFVTSAVTLTQARASKFAFTIPFADATQRLMKRKGDDRIKTLDDMAGKTIGVVLNSASEADLQDVNRTLNSKGLKLITIKEFTGYPEAYVALQNGSIDGVVNNFSSLAPFVAKRQNLFEIVSGNIGNPTWAAWIMRPEDTDMLDAVNKVLLNLHNNGTMAQLQKKWFGFTMDTPTKGYLPPGAVGHEPQ